MRNFISDGSRDWGVSENRIKLILILPFIIAFSGVVAALMGKPAYKLLTGEDKIAEYLQVACWMTSFLLTLWIVKESRGQGSGLNAVLYALLAIGIFFLIGEEISWGQRLFGWATPESYKTINKQDETNIHNLSGVWYAVKWVYLLIGAYGTFLPLLPLRSTSLAPYCGELSMIIPPRTLIPYFFMVFIWRVYRFLFEVPKNFYFVVTKYSEVIELILASGFVLFLLYQKRRLSQRANAATDG